MKIVAKDSNSQKEILDFLEGKDNHGYPFLTCTDIYDIQNCDGYILCAGECKWSVLDSLIEFKSLDEWDYTLPMLAKKFDCKIEVFSYEEGYAFAEHFIIDSDGSLFVKSCLKSN